MIQPSIEKLPKSQLEIEISVPEADLSVYLDKAAIRISEKVKIKGYRSGKAPRALIEKEFGKMAVLKEALDDIIQKSFVDVILKEKIDVIGTPEIDLIQIMPDAPIKFKAKVTVLPEIELGDYKDIKIGGEEIKLSPKKAEEKEIQEAVEYLQKSRAEFKNADRAVQKGDMAEIDFEGRMDGVKFEGGESKNHPLIIGEGNFIPGFEDSLIGMGSGEEKEFEIKFPEDYHKKEFAGKKTQFKVKINIIQERILPELTDEFVQSLGEFKTVDDLKKSIFNGIEQENLMKAKDKAKAQILDEIVKNSKMEIPDILIENELKKMEAELRDGTGRMEMKFEDYLSHIKKTIEDLKKEWVPAAERRVKSSLVLAKIAAKEQVEIPKEDLDAETTKAILNFGLKEEEAHKKIDMEKFSNYIRQSMMNEKTLDLLMKFNIK